MIAESDNQEFKIFFTIRRVSGRIKKEFLSSSVVERSTVNRVVVGSKPTWGDFFEIS